LVEEKNFSGISNLLITSSTYLENVFLFTLIETVELLFLIVQGSRPALAMVVAVLLALGHLPWSDNSVIQYIDLMV